MTTVMSTERRRWAMIIWRPSVGVEGYEDEIDELDEDEGDDDAAHPVDPYVAAQDGRRRRRAEPHPAQRQGNQRHDDQGVEDHRREDRALRAVELHDVERVQRSGDPGSR